MRKWIPLLLLVSSVGFAQAPAKDLSVGCDFQGTGVHIKGTQDKVTMTFVNPSGFANFPIYSGTLTPGMLPAVKNGLEDLKVFDGNVVVSWPRSQCEFAQSNLLIMQCDGKGKVESPAGVSLDSHGITTQLESFAGLKYTYNRFVINWTLTVEKPDLRFYFVRFPFDPATCWMK